MSSYSKDPIAPVFHPADPQIESEVMEKTADVEEDCFICRVSGALTISNTAQIWLDIYSHLKDRRPVEIELSQIDECDAAGMQLLLVLADRSRTSDLPVLFTHIPPAVLGAFKKCGIEPRRIFDELRESEHD